MITITKLNGSKQVINSELIETIDSTPDTVITMTTGKKLMVKESCDELIRRTIEYKRKIFTDFT